VFAHRSAEQREGGRKRFLLRRRRGPTPTLWIKTRPRKIALGPAGRKRRGKERTSRCSVESGAPPRLQTSEGSRKKGGGDHVRRETGGTERERTICSRAEKGVAARVAFVIKNNNGGKNDANRTGRKRKEKKRRYQRAPPQTDDVSQGAAKEGKSRGGRAQSEKERKKSSSVVKETRSLLRGR